MVAVEVTPSRVHDCRLLPALLDQIPGRIVQVSGDGAYDTRACYQSILEREAVATIPPRRSARLSESVDPPAWRAMRDAHLREIRRLGRYEWRISSGCTRQSLAENAMSRFKTLFGPKLSARRFDNQRVEAIIKCEVLNRMSSRACLSQCEFDSIQTGLGSVRDPTGIVQQRDSEDSPVFGSPLQHRVVTNRHVLFRVFNLCSQSNVALKCATDAGFRAIFRMRLVPPCRDIHDAVVEIFLQHHLGTTTSRREDCDLTVIPQIQISSPSLAWPVLLAFYFFALIVVIELNLALYYDLAHHFL